MYLKITLKYSNNYNWIQTFEHTCAAASVSAGNGPAAISKTMPLLCTTSLPRPLQFDSSQRTQHHRYE